MVHIFDRHKKWQDSENVQCLMCNSYIRSEKKKRTWKKNETTKSTFLFGRSEDQWRITGKITSKKEFKLWGVIKAKQRRKRYWMRKLKKRQEKKESQLLPGADSVCTHMPTFHRNTRKVFINGLAFWTRGLLMRRIGGQFCYRLQGYRLIRAEWLLFCVPNSFDILSWLPEVPWVGKAAIPLG